MQLPAWLFRYARSGVAPVSEGAQIVIYFRYLTEAPMKEDAMLFTEDERATHREPQAGWSYAYVGTWKPASVQDELPPAA